MWFWGNLMIRKYEKNSFFFRVTATMHSFSRCSLILFSGKILLRCKWLICSGMFLKMPLCLFSPTGFVKIILRGMLRTMSCWEINSRACPPNYRHRWSAGFPSTGLRRSRCSSRLIFKWMHYPAQKLSSLQCSGGKSIFKFLEMWNIFYCVVFKVLQLHIFCMAWYPPIRKKYMIIAMIKCTNTVLPGVFFFNYY